MPTPTTTYSLSKPTVGGDDNAWGTELNSALDKIDDLFDGTTAIKPNLDAGLWKVGGVAVTSTAAELNILDGVTATTAELNILDGVTATTAELNFVDGVTSAIQTQLDAKAASSAGVPSGAVAHFAMDTAPTGWLKANGAAVSRSTYAALFTAIGTTFGVGDGSTTFNVPDLRGEFMRGWDDGRGVDSGRAFGSTQDHQIQQHQHGLAFNADVTNATGGTTGATVSACSALATRNSAASNQLSTSYVQDAPYVKNATGANIGTETRPANIALLACIKF